MKKFLFVLAVAGLSLSTVAAPFGDDKKDKTKCENKAACCKTAKAEAGKDKKCCKGDAAKCSDKKAESAPKTEATEKK